MCFYVFMIYVFMINVFMMNVFMINVFYVGSMLELNCPLGINKAIEP